MTEEMQLAKGVQPRGKGHVKDKPSNRNVQQVARGTSFVDVVKGKGCNKIWQRKVERSDPEVWKGMGFVVKEEDIAWLSNCYVGGVHNPNTVYLL